MNDGWEKQKSPKPGKHSHRGRGSAYARALLAELSGKPSSLGDIASALQLDLREVEADGFEGALIRANNLPIGAIAVCKSIREVGRKNFTIAHEIGHFILPGHDHASLACTASDVANWENESKVKEIEREADEFAAELLMPVSLVEGIIEGATPSLQIIERIARKAGTSLAAASWRYCDLATEKCAVVWSTEGTIQWAKRSTGFPFFLPKGKPVEEGTFAAACFANAKVPRMPREVAADLWTPTATLTDSVVLLEQSKALPTYRSVISLLWIQDGRRKRR